MTPLEMYQRELDYQASRPATTEFVARLRQNLLEAYRKEADRPARPIALGRTDEAVILVRQLAHELGRMPLWKEARQRYPDLGQGTLHRAMKRVAAKN